MAFVNENFLSLASGYLFPEIARRTKAWQDKNPGQKVLRLGIGNTTEAITPHIAKAMHDKIDLLSRRETYTGYGDEQGDTALRTALFRATSRLSVQVSSALSRSGLGSPSLVLGLSP